MREVKKGDSVLFIETFVKNRTQQLMAHPGVVYSVSDKGTEVEFESKLASGDTGIVFISGLLDELTNNFRTKTFDCHWGVLTTRSGKVAALKSLLRQMEAEIEPYTKVVTALRRNLGLITPENNLTLARDEELSLVLEMTRHTRPLCNITVNLQNLDPHNLQAQTLKEEVVKALVENDYEIMAERFEMATEFVSNFYPVVFIAASFVSLCDDREEEIELLPEEDMETLKRQAVIETTNNEASNALWATNGKTFALEKAAIREVERHDLDVVPIFKFKKGEEDAYRAGTKEFSSFQSAVEWARVLKLCADKKSSAI